MSIKYSPQRLENACEKAKNMNSFSYTTVKNILKYGQDLVSVNNSDLRNKALPIHENIRGSNYFQ